MQVPLEGLAVIFTVLQIFGVEKNRWQIMGHVVVEPLSCGLFEERVSKEFFAIILVGGGKLAAMQRGRAVRRKCRIFDGTKGFPGEDVKT